MPWNDGISAELSEYLTQVSGKLGKAKEVAQEVIDYESDQFYERVDAKIPIATGGLKASLKKTKVESKPGWYGYEIDFVGDAPNGEPYRKIANIINYGTPTGSGTFFVSNATRKLKGMTGRIEARIEQELSKITEE